VLIWKAESISTDRISAVQETLRRHWAGHRTLLLVQTFNATAATAMRELASFGAEVCGVVTATPAAHDAPHVFACDGLSTTEFDAWLREPPAEFTRWLDELDPRRECGFLGTTFTHVGEVCERPVHGWRRPEWARLEDKTAIDQLWQRIGVPSPKHVVLPVDDPALPTVVAELDHGAGVILAMDSTSGFLGDAKGLRWVRTADEVATALQECRAGSQRVRVAEFVPGVPCSILGMVLADGVAVFDPIEIVTLRDRPRAGLVFCGSSTFWRPEGAATEQMRHYTRLAGREVASTMDYRGIFSVDGILGSDGFVATELNPRHCGCRKPHPRCPRPSATAEQVRSLAGSPSLEDARLEA
jgi:hypothetical protein